MIAGLNRYATLPDADMQHWHCWLGIIPMSQVLRVELAVFALPAPGARSIQTTSLTVDRFPVIPVVDQLPFAAAMASHQAKHDFILSC